ncbi:MAG: alpha-amylase family glycosyl hydrolase, partial [Bacteroidota bacterium]|nr:alpha-amylase family glycosyl hydrolase [Bacteroidota bacterium]
VDEAHNRGMKVILDWVANHSAWDNVWYPQHDAFYTKDSVTGERIPPVEDWADVADLNYDNVEMRDSMLDAFRYWVEEFDIDGYRCDVAGMVPIDFWQDMSSEVRSIKPDAFLLAEADEVVMHDNAFHMTYGWENHHILNEIAKGHMTANDLLAYFTKNDNTYGKSPYRMYFTSNHDENTWNGTVWERMGDAAHTMAALTYVMPSSMPLVYNGQEDSLAHQLAFFDKDDIGWSGQEVMGDFYRELNALKKDNEALWNGDFGGDYTARLEKGSVLVLERSKGDNSILAVFNLSNLPVPLDAGLIDVSNMTLETSRYATSDITSLAAWDYLIYSNN